ncbi:hypothetical protein FACS1894137_19230 [Spirochaetia bacterium]|nr:hypothetical protein FACS1894137_19230 [Spirochaetia bacterium]
MEIALTRLLPPYDRYGVEEKEGTIHIIHNQRVEKISIPVETPGILVPDAAGLQEGRLGIFFGAEKEGDAGIDKTKLLYFVDYGKGFRLETSKQKVTFGGYSYDVALSVAGRPTFLLAVINEETHREVLESHLPGSRLKESIREDPAELQD